MIEEDSKQAKKSLKAQLVERSQEDQIISILTYNLFMRPPGIKTNLDDFKNQRLQDLFHVLHQFDILCFQQLFQTGNFRAQRMIQYGIQKHFYYWKLSEAPKFWYGPPVDSGLLVMSKYPILSSEFHSYHIGVLSDSASDKGYIYCKIKVGQNILHLFNTHLQASYLNRAETAHEQDYTMLTRFYQLKMLRNKIRQILKAHGYKKKDLIILAGDFNLNARTELGKVHNAKFYKQYAQYLYEDQQEHTITINEYLVAKQIFKQGEMDLIDLALDTYVHHPVTFGDEDQIVLTGEQQQKTYQRLDYIFQIKLQQNQPRLMPMPKSCKVKQFKISQASPHRTYTQLSDHYGICVKCGEYSGIQNDKQCQGQEKFEEKLQTKAQIRLQEKQQ